MSVVSVCVECLEWLTCKVEEEDTTKHDSGPVTPTHHTQSGDCLFSAPGECWYSLGQTADLASTFRHCCQLGQNIQHTTKAFCVHFRFDKYFLSRARRRCGGRLDGLDADMRRWSEETRGSDLCPLSSEHLTEATLPLSRLIVHWKVSSDPPLQTRICASYCHFPGEFSTIRTSYWTLCHRGPSPRPSLSCHGLQLSRAMCNTVTIWQSDTGWHVDWM